MALVLDGTSGLTGNSGTLLSNSTVGVGAATPAASGAGITFPATQSASTDANTLDDYEEGDWTPSDASGASLSFTSVTATYEKIGRLVVARFALTYPATANASNAKIGGLPFTVGNSQNARQGFVGLSNETTLRYLYPDNNATTMQLVTNAGANITNATMSGDLVYGTAIYYVA